MLAGVSGVKRALCRFYTGTAAGIQCRGRVVAFESHQINPNRPMHYIELGQTYAQMGKTVEARRVIVQGLAMPT